MNPNLRSSKATLLLVPAMIILSLQLLAQSVIAQQVVFSPAETDVNLLESLFEKSEKRYKNTVAALPKENKEDYQKIYEQRWSNIKTKFDAKEIYTEATAGQYLDALVKEIVQANPLLKNSSFQCYFSRSGVPNASYIGEGIILVNMGLFHRLDNESQAAFILCHEIAHFYLQHSEKSINKYVTAINSEEVQQELRKIKGSEYRKREQLEKLVKGLSFSNFRHSRGRESEADSMAIEFLKNTGFKTAEALSALALLDTIDTDTLNTAACLPSLFHTQSYPFQKRWIAKEEGLLGGHASLKEDEELADSLKTHPDCKLRIKNLEPMVAQYSKEGQQLNVVDADKLSVLQNKFRYEIIEFAYSSKNYTRSLFYTLEMLQQKPGDAYLVAHAGKLFNGMYAAQKAHTLSRLVDLPSPAYPSNYNLLLQFIQNLYPENVASISYHFLNRYQLQLEFYEPYTKEYKASIMIAQQ